MAAVRPERPSPCPRCRPDQQCAVCFLHDYRVRQAVIHACRAGEIPVNELNARLRAATGDAA